MVWPSEGLAGLKWETLFSDTDVTECLLHSWALGSVCFVHDLNESHIKGYLETGQINQKMSNKKVVMLCDAKECLAHVKAPCMGVGDMGVLSELYRWHQGPAPSAHFRLCLLRPLASDSF